MLDNPFHEGIFPDSNLNFSWCNFKDISSHPALVPWEKGQIPQQEGFPLGNSGIQNGFPAPPSELSSQTGMSLLIAAQQGKGG